MQDGTSLATTYPDSKHADALAVGENYQDFVASVLRDRLGIVLHFLCTRQEQYDIGETKEGYEIKLDQWCTTTGRLSIEVGEKTRVDLPIFTPSGIMRNDNTVFYVQGNRARIWVFRKALLQHIYQVGGYPIIANRPPTIQKFYLPLARANTLAENVLMIC